MVFAKSDSLKGAVVAWLAAPPAYKSATTLVHKKLRLCCDSSWMKMNSSGIIIDKCRLCLADNDKNDLTPIFDGDDNPGLSLAARIMVCLSIPVESRDPLPHGVCKICENRVTQFYAFREICCNSYYSLLGQSVECEAEDLFKDTEEEVERPKLNLQDYNKTKLERVHKCQLDSEQNVHSSEAYLQEFSVEEVSAENLQSDSVADQVISTNIELESLRYKPNCQTEENQTYEKILSDEDIHFQEEVQDVKYKCSRCNCIFPDFSSASVHCAECSRLEQEEDDGNATAEHADSIEYLDENIREQVEKTTETFEEESLGNPRLEAHPTNVTSQRPSVLSYGNEITGTVATESSPIARRRKLHDKSSHSCPDCESIFSSAALLRRHSVVHTGERPFECPTCKKRFSQVGQLNFHKNFHENPRYRCDVCNKPFLRPSDIEKHMRTHTGEKPYGCSVCSKSFAQLVALQQHERIHTGDKPYVCEICGKSFSQKANKTKHVKIHKEGTKPHTCELCGRSFPDLEEMNLHRAGHGGGKPRKCNHCEGRFRKTSELVQHIRRYHTFERPHKCAFCQKAFYSRYNLKQHVMVHTGQKPYACKQCDLRFTQKGNLTKHIERKHADICDIVAESEEELRGKISSTTDTPVNSIYACAYCNLNFNEKDKFQRHLDQHENYTIDRDKFVVIRSEECVEINEQEILM